MERGFKIGINEWGSKVQIRNRGWDVCRMMVFSTYKGNFLIKPVGLTMERGSDTRSFKGDDFISSTRMKYF